METQYDMEVEYQYHTEETPTQQDIENYQIQYFYQMLQQVRLLLNIN